MQYRSLPQRKGAPKKALLLGRGISNLALDNPLPRLGILACLIGTKEKRWGEKQKDYRKRPVLAGPDRVSKFECPPKKKDNSRQNGMPPIRNVAPYTRLGSLRISVKEVGVREAPHGKEREYDRDVVVLLPCLWVAQGD